MKYLIREKNYRKIRNSIPDADCYNGDQYSIRVEFSDDVRIYNDEGEKVNVGILKFNKVFRAGITNWLTDHVDIEPDPNENCVVIITK